MPVVLEEELSEKLILRLSSQSHSSIPWLVWENLNNDVIASGELEHQSELSHLVDYAKGRQVIVLINSADVRFYRHYMPTKPSRQILKALPFMLEDELSEDIEELHFATHENGFDEEKNQYFVNLVIVRKSLMEHWSSLLAEHNLSAKVMLPDVMCLSTEQNTISTIEFSNGWLVNDGNWQASFIDHNWFELFWLQQLKIQGDEPLTIHAYSPLPDQFSEMLQQQTAVEIKAMSPELPLLQLANNALTTKWNLLQGDYTPKKPTNKNWQAWQPVAILLLVTLVVHMALLGTRWSKATAELEVAKQSLSDSYKQAFPKERVRLNIIRTQLNRKVAQATGESVTDTGFLQMMEQLTPVFNQFSSVNYESFRFDGTRQELRINASAASFQQFEQLTSAIKELGLDVQQGAVNNEGELVTGALSVKRSD